jgi:hypothetical protein
MKNQNDLIFSIVGAVLGIGFSVAFFFMKRDPVSPPAPQQVVTAQLAYPAAAPVVANGLPGGGGSSGGGSSPFGGGSPFGAGGPPPGMGGMGAGGGRPRMGMSGSAPSGGSRGSGGRNTE